MPRPDIYHTYADTLWTVHEFQTLAYRINKMNGWHSQPRHIMTTLMLIGTEIDECIDAKEHEQGVRAAKIKGTKKKPCYASRVLEECADIVIRLWDTVEEFRLNEETDSPIRFKDTLPMHSNDSDMSRETLDYLEIVFDRVMPYINADLSEKLNKDAGIPHESVYAARIADQLLPFYEKAIYRYVTTGGDELDGTTIPKDVEKIPMAMFRQCAKLAEEWRKPAKADIKYIESLLADLYMCAVTYGLHSLKKETYTTKKGKTKKMWNHKKCIRWGSFHYAARVKIRANGKRGKRHGGKRA